MAVNVLTEQLAKQGEVDEAAAHRCVPAGVLLPVVEFEEGL